MPSTSKVDVAFPSGEGSRPEAWADWASKNLTLGLSGECAFPRVPFQGRSVLDLSSVDGVRPFTVAFRSELGWKLLGQDSFTILTSTSASVHPLSIPEGSRVAATHTPVGDLVLIRNSMAQGASDIALLQADGTARLLTARFSIQNQAIDVAVPVPVPAESALGLRGHGMIFMSTLLDNASQNLHSCLLSETEVGPCTPIGDNFRGIETVHVLSDGTVVALHDEYAEIGTFANGRWTFETQNVPGYDLSWSLVKGDRVFAILRSPDSGVPYLVSFGRLPLEAYALDAAARSCVLTTDAEDVHFLCARGPSYVFRDGKGVSTRENTGWSREAVILAADKGEVLGEDECGRLFIATAHGYSVVDAPSTCVVALAGKALDTMGITPTGMRPIRWDPELSFEVETPVDWPGQPLSGVREGAGSLLLTRKDEAQALVRVDESFQTQVLAELQGDCSALTSVRPDLALVVCDARLISWTPEGVRTLELEWIPREPEGSCEVWDVESMGGIIWVTGDCGLLRLIPDSAGKLRTTVLIPSEELPNSVEIDDQALLAPDQVLLSRRNLVTELEDPDTQPSLRSLTQTSILSRLAGSGPSLVGVLRGERGIVPLGGTRAAFLPSPDGILQLTPDRLLFISRRRLFEGSLR